MIQQQQTLTIGLELTSVEIGTGIAPLGELLKEAARIAFRHLPDTMRGDREMEFVARKAIRAFCNEMIRTDDFPAGLEPEITFSQNWLNRGSRFEPVQSRN